MSYSELTLDERLSRTKQVLATVQSHVELAALLAARSYTAEKIKVGARFQQDAEQKHALQVREYGEAVGATAAYQDLWKSIHDEMVAIRGVAKVALKSEPKLAYVLLLHTKLKQTIEGSLGQIATILNNVTETPVILDYLSPYGISVSTFSSLNTRIDQLRKLKTQRDAEYSEAQQATRIRDEAVDLMDDWMTDFLEIARFAVASKPEYLEMLGEVVPS